MFSRDPIGERGALGRATVANHRLFFFCYEHTTPSGGNKQMYRQVDMLNRNGFEAYVFHPHVGFRLSWFANETRVLDQESVKRIYDPAADILILPEDLGAKILNFPGKKVILNQNVFYGFAAFGQETRPCDPYLDSDVVAVLTKSEHNTAYLRFAYPGVKIIRIFNGVDFARFRHCPLADKKKQIACIVKAPLELYTLFHMLQARARQGLNKLGDFRWVFIENKTEAQVADILHESLIFVFFSLLEGMAVIPMEAMLSGCLVTAFGAGPISEHVPSVACFAPNDILEVARRIEAIAESFPDRIGDWEEPAEAGRQAALRFTLERQEASIVKAWKEILETAFPVPR
jgi:glycosyltransferase involved in cell wall biosynthesis